ncbi:10753_t:CDS:1, partial [Acaulospora morrowiae]
NKTGDPQTSKPLLTRKVLLQASSGKSTADDPFQGVHAILVIVGDISEENPYQKSTALQVNLSRWKPQFNDQNAS